MKFLNKSLIAALAVSMAALTSCSDDDSYQPGPESAGCYFETVPETQTISSQESSFAVNIARSVTDDAISVPVEMIDESGLFSGPATVDFAAGQASAEYVISYDADKLEADKNYPITLKLASDFQYGVTEYSFNAKIPAPFKSLGMCTYTDNIVSSLYKIDILTWEVEIQESDIYPGLYRLVNPYKDSAIEQTYNGVTYNDSEDHHMEIHAENPNQVYFNLFNTGLTLDPDYGEILAVSLGARYLEAGNPADKIEQAGYFGTLVDGVITFPVDGISVVEVAEYGSGWYKGNASGREQILFPGVELSDYSATISYAGLSINPDGDKFAVANVELGADVESAIVAAVQTDDAQSCLTAMLTGSAEIVEISNTGETQRVEAPISENGPYTMMIVTIAKDSYQELDYVQFEVELGGKQWNEVGLVEILDGWLLPFLSSGGVPLDPEQHMWYCALEENVSTPGLYRIRGMYNASMLADYVSGTKNIIVDCTNPEWVKLAPQSSGVAGLFAFNGAAAIPYIANQYGYYIDILGATEQQAQEACKYQAKLEDGVITFPKGDCGKIYAEDPDLRFYNAARVNDELVTYGATMTLLLDEAEGASLKAKVRRAVPKSMRDIKANRAQISTLPAPAKPLRTAKPSTDKCFRLK